MNILISGGGLAGLTLGYWLKQFGMHPVIIERAQGLRRDGYGIDFFGTGYDVAERMGIIDRLAQQKILADGVYYVNEEGKPLTQLSMDLMQKVMNGHYIPLMHWTLEEALYDCIKDDVEVRFGCSLSAVEQTEDSVQVTFDDGSIETYDLLIGADGIHSNTRALVFGPEAQYGRYLGYYVACFAMPDRYGVGNTWKNYIEPQRQVGAYCSNNPGELITFYMWQAPDTGPIPRAERLPTLKRVFKGMGWLAETLLNDLPEDAPIFCDTVTQIVMPEWSKGRVALVGDACGCMTLVSGQGASMALGGAYLLAEALHTQPDYASAFHAYETFLRPHIEQRQKSARDFAKSFVPGSQLGLMVQKVVLKIIARDAFVGVLRSMFGGDSILQTRALQRLPQSEGALIGYSFSGQIHASDYETLVLDIDHALEEHKQVQLLFELKDVTGIDFKAMWADLKFGLSHGRDIGKLAVVGDQRLSEWMAKLAKPLYAQAVRHFSASERAAAWAWLREA